MRSAVMVVVLSGLVMPSSIMAQNAPDPRLYPGSIRYDLAEMTLTAGDFPIDGLFFLKGELVGPERYAGGVSESLGMAPDALLDEIDELGWQAQYLGSYGVADANGTNDALSIYVNSYVTMYKDEQGARDGFAFFEDEQDGSANLTAPAVGEESELTQSEGVLEGLPFVKLDYTFRTGAFVAGISIYWWHGDETDFVTPESIAASAETLLMKVEAGAAKGDVGTFGRHARLEASEQVTITQPVEYYVMLDGQMPLFKGETEADIEEDLAFWTASGVQQFYYSSSTLAPAADPGDVTMVIMRTFKLGSAREARTFVEPSVTKWIEAAPDVGYASVETMETVPGVEGVVAGAEYTWPLGGGAESKGVKLWMQSGSYVVSVEADNPDGVDLNVMIDILQAQADCADASRFCRPIEIPEGLVR